MSKPASEQYVDAVNSADLDILMKLFVDDAVLQHPVGTFTGTEEMRGFYRDVVFAGQAVTQIVSSCNGVDREWVEIEATSPLSDNDGCVYAADVFDLAPDGRISRLAIYYR